MKFFQLVPENTNYDFVGKAKFFSTLSAIVIAGMVFLLFTKGLNFGIDFTGGTVVQARFLEPTNTEEVRTIVTEMGEQETSVVAIGTEQREFLITVRTERETTDKQPLDQRLKAKVGEDKVQILQVDIVGPKVGEELKWSAIRSLFYSLILIMIYIWFRFDLRFAPGATLALCHDLIFVAGFYVISGRQFTIASVAALLTTAGYSVNDTIVIYDRVREILGKGAGGNFPLKETLNRAINQSLSRTLMTSLTTAMALLPIILFTTGDLNAFADAMLVGIIVGTFSTMYIASPFTVFFQRFLDKQGASKPATA